MSLISIKTTTIRALALTALVAAEVFAHPPQTSGAQAATVRRRSSCVNCSDSARAKHDMLLTKLDSLRWEFGNRRLTESEQLVFAREISATMQALQAFMEANGARVSASATATGATAGSGDSFTFSVQVSKRGYLGITFDGPSYGYPPERPDVIRFIQYPKIASVDPASPAERAGLIIGDTLLAMNGTDVVENSITLSKILIPDDKVTLRIRRDGDAKEFRVVVAEAPAYIVRRVTPMPPDVVTIVPSPYGAVAPVPAQTPRAEVGVRGRAPEPAAVPRAPDAQAAPRVFLFGPAIGGARVQTITAGLSKALGVKEGVLVTEVPPGSPAHYSDLRDGDVIISAAGTDVATERALSRVIMFADREDGVTLVILRDKKRQEVVLRWK